jgi:hypothetical protein
MFKNLLMTLAILLATCTMAMAQQGRLKGKITDDTGEPVPFANVIIEKGGSQMGGASSDFDGNYDINPIPPGTYTLKASCVGYNAFQVNNIVIPANKITYYDIKMVGGSISLDAVIVVDYEIPLISKDNTTSGESVTAEEIAKLPNRSAEGVAASVGGVFSADGEVGSIRGSREGAVYYIDGVRVIGNGSVPQGAIDQVDVILGGTPAQYGDASGGIINMTTKGPSRTWGGGVEYEHSIEGYGHKRLGLSLNGPLLKKRNAEGEKEEESLLGFFLAADLAHNRVGSLSATNFYRATDEWMDYIETNPLTLGGSGTGSNVMASYTHKENLFETRYLNNTTNWSVNVNGKIDVRTGANTNLTLGGSLYRGQGRYANGRSNYFFNTDKNYLSKSSTYRGYVRFSQRFPSDPESTSLISNVYYSIQADYTHYFSEYGDADLWDNIFAYGNIGKFTTYRAPNYYFSELTVDSVWVDDSHYQSFNNVWVLNNFYDTLVEFQRTDYDFNPLLANYVENYYDLYDEYGSYGYFNNMSNIVLNRGLINGMAPSIAYGMYRVPGTIQTSYGKTSTDQFAVNVNGSMTIGRGDNSHEIKLGLQYELRNRSYMSFQGAPYTTQTGYWSLMSDLTNYHIQELDMNSAYATSIDGIVDTINYHRMYDADMQYTFDANLRKAMGLNPQGTDWILIDTYDFDDNSIMYYDEEGVMHKGHLPNGFDLSMFSADELTRDGNFYVDYCGYTYDGKRKYGFSERPTMEDFFNNKDDNGNFTREIAAQQPIYMAGYIQDKFAFKDLIFNIGVRVDRFDANQKVLKDPYVLYDFYNVGAIRNALASGELAREDNSYHFVGDASEINIPSNIGDDYVPYVNKVDEMKEIVGYRTGHTWFNAEGKEIADAEDLNMGTGVTPWVKNPSQSEVNKESFNDYNPAWSVMPRISFSFPISDEALFYAHYDILTQRPTENYYCSPLIYLHFNEYGQTVENPDLQPSQTIDYELGFKQKLNNTSSLTITAYYRELRNMIQMYRFNGAYPKAYNSYSNLDFGTVKGLTASYDLRRTKNARVRASYTLQFDNKTGASATTASALIAAGVPNLRSTYPSNSDRRHGFNLTLDYRFKDGKDYNGPVIKREKSGKNPIQLLANTGFSLTVNGGSGAPYTAARKVLSPIQGGTSLLKGTYNGSRMPASFRFDLRVDKDIKFKIGGNEEGKKAHEAFVNVYLQVLNLLNSKNIMSVYSATGNANDDGYLSAPEWQREIYSQLDPEAYITMYQIYVNSGGNYSTPRQIRLGLSFNF